MLNASNDQVILVCTNDAIEYANKLANELGKVSFGPPIFIDDALSWLKDKDNTNSRINKVIVLIQQKTDGDVWGKFGNNVKSIEPYAELILVASEGSLDASQVLQGTYFGYFEPEFPISVLVGYIDAALYRIKRRRARSASSEQLNKEETLSKVVEEIRNQLKILTNFDRATFVLLHERNYINDVDNDKISRLCRTLVSVNYDGDSVNWDLLQPIKSDKLIHQILSGERKQKVFSNVKEELKNLWKPSDVESWIALPLIYQDKPIGLITLDAIGKNRFTYDNISEVALIQFANQAAIAIHSAQQIEASKRLNKALEAVSQQDSLNEALGVIAKQSCELAQGLFSYVVMPDKSGSKLQFVSAWSRDSKGDFLDQIQSTLRYFDLRDPNQNQYGSEAVTVKAYHSQREILLDDCLDKFSGVLQKYRLDDYNAYLPYSYRDANGKRVLTSSEIAIPIIDEHQPKRVLGVINIEHEYPCAFTSQQLDALRSFAKFAAIAIRNYLATERVKLLFTASNIATGITTQGDLLDRLANETQQVAGADAGVKIFAKIDNKTVIVGGSADVRNIPERANTRGEKGHTMWCIEHNTPIIINDVDDYNANRTIDEKYGKYRHITINHQTIEDDHHAILCLPMRLNDDDTTDKIVGAIWLHFSAKQQFTKEQIEDLQIYANRAAVALYNDYERKFLYLAEKISSGEIEYNNDEIRLEDMIVDYVRKRFGVQGVLFYKANRNSRRLERIAVSYNIRDNNQKVYFLPRFTKEESNDAFVRYNEGLAGHVFQGEKDRYDYTPRTYHVPDYSKYEHRIQKDADKGILESLFAVRLENLLSPKKKIGVLVIADRKERTYHESKHEIERFANLAASLLMLHNVETKKPYVVQWLKSLIRYFSVFFFAVIAHMLGLFTSNSLAALGIILFVGWVITSVSNMGERIDNWLDKRIE